MPISLNLPFSNQLKMRRTEIKAVLSDGKFGDQVNVKGWVKAFRQNRFIQLNDGSTINNVQAVIDFENTDEALIKPVSYTHLTLPTTSRV